MTSTDTAVTARLAAFAVETDPATWPDTVRREALRSFFNAMGCALGGARHRARSRSARRRRCNELGSGGAARQHAAESLDALLRLNLPAPHGLRSSGERRR